MLLVLRQNMTIIELLKKRPSAEPLFPATLVSPEDVLFAPISNIEEYNLFKLNLKDEEFRRKVVSTYYPISCYF